MTVHVCHPALDLLTPDTIAECWNCSEDLYAALWDCVPSYAPIDREDCGPGDVVGINCVSGYWSRFSPDQQAELNRLAGEEDARWQGSWHPVDFDDDGLPL